MNHRKIITFYYIKMRYTDVYDKQSSLELKIYSDTDETPGNVSVQAGAEIIINQQLS